MKIADFISALMGAESSLLIPLPASCTRDQAEQARIVTTEACPMFDVQLLERRGFYVLLVSRREDAARVPYDA